MKDFSAFINTRDFSSYQRENFDAFLKKIKFEYKTPSIHIAGTNGKGSTAKYIASIYQEAGYKVGLFTSPFFYEMNESILINDEQINDENLLKYVRNNEKLIKKYDLSAFEILTFIALSYFDDCSCDIAVIECGMGGEIDATNVFDSILSIITSVSLEHTNFLGRTISEIAENKAGIIKDGSHVLIGDFSEDAINAIVKVAKEKDTTIHSSAFPAKEVFSDQGTSFAYKNYSELKIKSFAHYSVVDACYAIDAVDLLNDKYPVNEDNIRNGLYKYCIPCRMELISHDPYIVIDGAHNPEALSQLKHAFVVSHRYRPIHTVFACFKDKNLPKMLAVVGEMSDTLVISTFDHPRARTYDDYFLFAEEHEFNPSPLDAVEKLIEFHPNDTILITGSLAFAAYMRKELIKKYGFNK